MKEVTERIYTERVFKGHGSTFLVPDVPCEEIVRCRDCLYWEDDDYCLHWQTSRYEAPCCDADDFCSYAEKKVD